MAGVAEVCEVFLVSGKIDVKDRHDGLEVILMLSWILFTSISP